MLYDIDEYDQLNLKPEYIVGCVVQDHGDCQFYIKDDIIKEKTK